MDIDAINEMIDVNRTREEPESMQDYLENCICDGYACVCGMPVDVVVREGHYRSHVGLFTNERRMYWR